MGVAFGATSAGFKVNQVIKDVKAEKPAEEIALDLLGLGSLVQPRFVVVLEPEADGFDGLPISLPPMLENLARQAQIENPVLEKKVIGGMEVITKEDLSKSCKSFYNRKRFWIFH